MSAVARELSWLGEPREVDTLFFGGGTPTQLPLAELGRLFEGVLRWFPPAAGCEISVEVNPADIDRAVVELLAGCGVNRLSLGVQSFDDVKLATLERDHRGADVRRALDLARERFDSVSLDLIFATPGETLDRWRDDLAGAVSLEPEHVSTYGLTYEKGTTFWSRQSRGELRETDDEDWRAMYAAAIDTLAAAGWEHYEVSNFARPGHRCRHNEVYWSGGEYFAVGPGAARYVEGRRETNHRSTTTWLKRVLGGQSPVAESEMLCPEDRARELLVLGLRRIEGVQRAEFRRRSGYEVDELAGPQLGRFVEQGLLVDDGLRVRLTREGLFVSDALWPGLLRR